jgi:predicted Zn finger-like uncharacterized protein
MNVACPSCPAKYAVPDEKVRGKKARITCKRCGSAIIVDGTSLQASRPPPKPRAEPLPPPPTASAEPAPSAQEWLVAITDDRQEPASVDEIVAWYSASVIDADTFIWKDGMAEWQTPFEIAEIAQALEQQGLERRVLEPGIESAPGSVPTYDDEEATHIGRPLGSPVTAGTWTEPGRWGGDDQGIEQPYDDEMTIARESAPLASPYPLQTETSDEDQTIAREPSSPFSAPLPAAGRPPDSAPPERAGSDPGKRRYVRPQRQESERANPAARRIDPRPERAVADLFGAQAGAGAEDDPSLGRGDSVPPDDGGAKLTGARNETSVLFSLDALIKQEAAPESKRSVRPETSKQREADLLLGGAGPSSIAGLGGDFNALVAPDMLAAPARMPDPQFAPPGMEDMYPRSKGGRVFKILLLVLLAGAIGAAIAVLVPKLLSPPPPPPPVATEKPVEPAPKPTETATAAATETAAPTGEASAAPPPTGVANTPKPETAPRPPSGGGRTEPTPPAAPASKPEDTKPASLGDAMAEGTTTPFDQNAAKSALVTAANGAAGCKQEGGPTGTGRALVTFAPSGRVTKAEITGDFAGTSVGGCVARLFRAARVPKFGGDPTTVSKNFTIQ